MRAFFSIACVLLSIAFADEPWKRHTIDASSHGADGVRLADVNEDGLMDIATGWEEGGVVRAYLHPGPGKEGAPWPVVTVGKVTSAEDAVFVDLDGDGAMDVVSACEGKTRSAFVHWAPNAANDYLKENRWKTATFPKTAGKQAWMYTLPMQIDGQHGMDLIIGSKGDQGSISWLQAPENPRHVATWNLHPLEKAGWIMSLIHADMDADGDDDLLVSDRRGERRGVYWLEFPGTVAAAKGSRWKRHDIGGKDRETLFLDHGDVDQDGTLDVVAIEKRGIVWYRKASNNQWTEHFIPMPKGTGGGKSVAVCDVDQDSHQDLVFSCEGADGPLSGMRWLYWENSPITGPWTSREIAGEPGNKYDRVVPYDVDGDGDADMLCCEERDGLGVFWYENPHIP